MQPKDLVGMLLKLQAGDVLFIDEIHRLPAPVEEFLYSAMEDFHVDVTIDSGLHATTESFKLQPFTLVGATTRAGSLTSALRSRFGLVHHMTLYDQEGLQAILKGVADRLKLNAAPEALAELAGKSRGTPRIAIRLRGGPTTGREPEGAVRWILKRHKLAWNSGVLTTWEPTSWTVATSRLWPRPIEADPQEWKRLRQPLVRTHEP